MKARMRSLAGSAVAILSALSIAGVAHAQPAQERVLDDFEDLAAWSVVATDDVKAGLRRASGPAGSAGCLDFDFDRYDPGQVRVQFFLRQKRQTTTATHDPLVRSL